MGDDAAEGLMCSGCGVYFEKAHGYPVLCRACWGHRSPKERAEAGVQRAELREL